MENTPTLLYANPEAQQEIKDFPCECKSHWRYREKTYEGCDSSAPDWDSPWCYVNDGKKCTEKDVEESSVQGNVFYRRCFISENDKTCEGEYTASQQECDQVCGEKQITETYTVTRGNPKRCKKPDRTVDCPSKEKCTKCSGEWVRYNIFRGQSNACDQTCGEKEVVEEFVVTPGTNPDCDLEYKTRTVACPTKVKCVKCEGTWETTDSCDDLCGEDKSVTETYRITQESTNPDTGQCPHQEGEERKKPCNLPACVQCTGEWVEGTCKKTCGKEERVDTYHITQHSTDGSSCDFEDKETRNVPCNHSECTPCEGKWKEGTCTKKCGEEDRTDTYEIVQQPNDGSSCPHLDGEQRTVNCGNRRCVPCRGAWETDEQCDHTCGSKFITETFRVLEEGDTPCEFNHGDTRVVDCPNKEACVGCIGEWVQGKCKQTCGDETRVDTYQVLQHSTDGTKCPVQDETTREASCNHKPCIDCKGRWAETQACTKTCGPDASVETYQVETEALGGKACEFKDGETKTTECSLPECQSCVGEWVDQGTCDQTCGDKTIMQVYQVVEPGNDGSKCLFEAGETREKQCPKAPPCRPCEGRWEETNACTQTCGEEEKTEVYRVTQRPTDGTFCEIKDRSTRTTACNNPACKSCTGTWEATTQCAEKCGEETYTMTYRVQDPGNNGSECPHKDKETKEVDCRHQECQSCAGEWVLNGKCDQSCGGKTLEEVYRVVEPGNDGEGCEFKDGETRPSECAVTVPCRPCVGAWTTTQGCTKTCGIDEKIETYNIIKPATDGSKCSEKDGVVRKTSCGLEECKDCKGEWTRAPDQCTKACGEEFQTETYRITEKGNQNACTFKDGETRQVPCDNEACKPCQGEWTANESCDNICGEKTITEVFVVTDEGNNPDASCKARNGDTRTKVCPKKPDCRPCKGEWDVQKQCSQRCGPEKQLEVFRVTQQPTDGTACPAATRETDCNNPECVDCKGEWNESTQCTKPCGDEFKEETYRITEKGNRKACDFKDGETRKVPCNNEACVPCRGEWTTKETCDNICGDKTILETFSVLKRGNDPQARCEANNGETRVIECPKKPDCHPCKGEWSVQKQCSQRCGPEKQLEVFRVTQQPTDGTACPVATRRETDCNNPDCVDCKGGWNESTQCTKPCGDEFKEETYRITEKGNRKACDFKDGETRQVSCDNEACVPCQGEWTTNEACDNLCGEKTITEVFMVTVQGNDPGNKCEAMQYDRRIKKCPKKPDCHPCKGEWSVQEEQCSQTCGPEKQIDVFRVSQQPTDGSRCPIADGTARETDCNHPECRDCKGGWSESTQCTKPCGDEFKEETYRITEKGNRKACDFQDRETRKVPCNNEACVPCRGEWTTDETCNHACGEKTITETFTITFPGNDEAGCSHKDGETRTRQCPKKDDCRPCKGEWSVREQCSQTCGPEKQIDVFRVSQQPTDGSRCPIADGTTRETVCNHPECRDCKGQWEETTQCKEACGDEFKEETYRITEKGNRKACDFKDGETRKVSCNNEACVPCQGEWATDETCNHACGEKTITETFTITSPGNDPGATCGFKDGETRTKQCPKKEACHGCKGVWLKGPCMKSCGAEKRIEVYRILQQPTDGTKCDFDDNATRKTDCQNPECVDCQGQWVSGGSCGCGTQFATETYRIGSKGQGGKPCEFKDGETRVKECPKARQNCQDCIGHWSQGKCDAPCGNGSRTDVYNIDTPAVGEGEACEALEGATRTAKCKERECNACIGEWQKQEACDHLCGEKAVEEVFRVSQEGEGDNKCPDERSRAVACPSKARCQPCEGEWRVTDECNKPCGKEERVETYTITQMATNETSCPHSQGEIRKTPCDHKPCQSCKGEWDLGKCTQNCGPEQRVDTFRITQTATDGSKCSYADNEERESRCNHPACVPCTGAWVRETDACNHTCGDKKVNEVYQISEAGTDGSTCPFKDGDTRTVDCPNKGACVPCQGAWKKGTCTKTCGEEMRTDTFVLKNASTDGSSCPFEDDETRKESCGHPECIDCVGEWIDAPCTQDCGQEAVVSTYTVREKGNGGKACPFQGGDTKEVQCRLPSCFSKFKQEICHPNDSVCKETTDTAYFCNILGMETCTEPLIKTTIDRLCAKYNFEEDTCNFSFVRNAMYKEKIENENEQRDDMFAEIATQKEALEKETKRLKIREEKINSQLSKMQVENKNLKTKIARVEDRLNTQEDELKERERMLDMKEKRLIRKDLQQKKQQTIEDDAWKMFREFEREKNDAKMFVDNMMDSKPYVSNLCALTSGRRLSPYECNELILDVGYNCASSCLKDYGGGFNTSECKVAIKEFSDKKVSCQLFSAIFSPEKLTTEELKIANTDPLYSEIQEILSIEETEPPKQTTKLVCGNPDLDSDVCGEFGQAYEFPTVYQNGICEMTAIDNKDDCEEFGAESEGFAWTQITAK
jgi:hypothetical protein